MKRASISVSSNIAEGFGRKSAKDKEHFYVMAYGSLTELENQVLLCVELGFAVDYETDYLLEQMKSVGQLINGLLRAHRKNQ